jgi:hypothetical protein
MELLSVMVARLEMDQKAANYFKVHPAPNDKFYVTRNEQAVCTRRGSLLYFETKRDGLEFLAEIGDIVVH